MSRAYLSKIKAITQRYTPRIKTTTATAHMRTRVIILTVVITK